jgi:purine-nucleoside phosphorylase
MDPDLTSSAEWLRERLPHPPLVGVILGSGLGDFADAVERSVTIPYAKIPGFPASAVVGHAGALVAGTIRSVPAVVLSGRVHFYEGHPMASVVFPARVLGLLGCRTVIVTNAAGGIDTSFRSGNLMLIEDHINGFGTNPLVGANEDDLGPRFPDMSDAYRRDLRSVAFAVAKRERITLRKGVYVGVHGPSYETPAEIRAFRRWGAHAVGMSTIPEVIALNQMGVGVIGISCITNMAAGVLKKPLVHTEVLETTQRVKGEFVRLLTALVRALGEGRSGATEDAFAPKWHPPKTAGRAPAGKRKART